MAASDIKQRLKEMKKRWAKDKDEAPGPPEGLYRMKLQDASLATSQSSGKLMIKREHLILSGEYKGETVYDSIQLETDWGPYFVAQWFRQMGQEPPDDINDIEEAIIAVVEESPEYTAKIKKSEGFSNVAIVKLLDGDEDEDEDDDSEEDEEDEDDDSDLEDEEDEDDDSEEDEEDEDDDSDFVAEVGDTVQFKAGKLTVTGEVTEVMADGKIRVKRTDNGKTTVLKEDQYEVIEADSEEDEEDEDDDSDLEDLIAFCESIGYEVPDDPTLESLKKGLSKWDIDADMLATEELELLKRLGIKISVKQKPAPKKPAKSVKPTKPARRSK